MDAAAAVAAADVKSKQCCDLSQIFCYCAVISDSLFSCTGVVE